MTLNESQREILTLKQTSAETGFCEETLRRHVRSGDLKAIRLGPRGYIKIRRAALDKWLTKLEKASPKAQDAPSNAQVAA